MKIVTVDGQNPKAAYINAANVDSRMDGLRIGIRIKRKRLEAFLYAEDREAAMYWSRDEMNKVLADAKALAQSGNVDMCDDREVEAWII